MVYKIGEQKILKRPTFLYKGIFIFQNSPVLIKDIKQKEEGIFYSVEYIDREGNPIIIENIKHEELE